MSESTIPTPADVAPPAQAADVPAPAAPKVDETDWKAEAVKWEKRSKENYSAAQRLAEIEQANKTAEEKTAERLTAAEKKATEAEAKVLRRDVAIEYKLDTSDAALLDSITDEDAMRALGARLMALATQAPEAPPALPVGPTVPGQQPGGAPAPAQITRSDLDALGAAGKTDEINRLRREGRLSHLLGGQ